MIDVYYSDDFQAQARENFCCWYKITQCSLSMYDSELISITMLIAWQIWKKAFFGNQSHPNGLFACKMSNSYLLKANTLKNMNKDLHLAILLIPVANFRHQSLVDNNDQISSK